MREDVGYRDTPHLKIGLSWQKSVGTARIIMHSAAGGGGVGGRGGGGGGDGGGGCW